MKLTKKLLIAGICASVIAVTTAQANPIAIGAGVLAWLRTTTLVAGAASAISNVGGAIAASPLSHTAVGYALTGIVSVIGGIKIFITSQDLNSVDNPDLNAVAATQVAAPTGFKNFAMSVGGVTEKFIYIQGPTGTTTKTIAEVAGGVEFVQKVDAWLKNKGYTRSYVNSSTGEYITDVGTHGNFMFNSSNCNPVGTCVTLYASVNCPSSFTTKCSTGTLPAGIATQTIGGNTSTTAATIALKIPMAVVENAAVCGDGSAWDMNSGLCMQNAVGEQVLTGDGVCAVSWAENGCPVRNPFDGDCGGLNLSCGSTTMPPSVSAKDGVTGELLEVVRPRAGQTGAGATTVTSAMPDVVNGVTKRAITNVNNATGTVAENKTDYREGLNAANPGAAISQTVVTNWPEGFAQLGSSVDKLASAADRLAAKDLSVNVAAPNVNVNVPDTLKIDEEGQTGELPAAIVEADTSTILDPLKERLEQFFNFKFPVHTSQCPIIVIDWQIFGGTELEQNIYASSSFMCDFIENNKDLIAGLVMFAYIIGAILIVLSA